MISEEMRNDLVEGMSEVLADKLDRIILYGSEVRGEAKEDSDVDVALIVNRRLSEDEKNGFISRNAMLDIKYGKIFSIVDIQADMLRKWGEVLPFYKSILQEGLVLWKAA